MTYSTGFGYDFPLRLADINHDGRIDVVVHSVSYQELQIFLGNGDGTLTAGNRLSFAPYVDFYEFDVGDITNDGHPDLIIPSLQGPGIFVCPGRGDGTFEDFGGYSLSSDPTSSVLADVDGDGLDDLVVAHENPGSISVLLNHGKDLPTPVMMSLVEATADVEKVTLAWFSGMERGVQASVLRKAPSQEWNGVGRIEGRSDGYLRFEDHPVVAGRYGYRLSWRAGGGEASLTEPVWLDVPARMAMSLGPWPTPSRGVLRIAFSVDAGEARLELFDTGARRIDGLVVHGSKSMAEHTFGGRQRLQPGVYFVRLVQGDRALVKRAIVIR